MCAIVDNNVAPEVFGDNQTPAGKHFYDWLMRRNGGTLVAGGKLLRELSPNLKFKAVFGERLRAGRAKLVPDDAIKSALDDLPNEFVKSDDHHVLALANVSGARLLFTNDSKLQDDFRNRRIIRGTQGRIYTTNQSTEVSDTHKSYFSGRWRLCEG